MAKQNQAAPAAAPAATKAPAQAAAPASRKTACPVTREEFTENAKPVTVQIGANVLAANTKEFSTGSFGWYANGKAVIEVNGTPVTCQVGISITAVGSKELE